MNPITTENARPGTFDWQLEHPATAREIDGYALVPRRLCPAAQQITRNVLRRFGAVT